jgi:cysteine synthase
VFPMPPGWSVDLYLKDESVHPTGSLKHRLARSLFLGRYVRYKRHNTRVAVVDPERSAFYPAWTEEDWTATGVGSRIESIGRPRVEPSFIPSVIDRMVRVPDAASIAAMRWVSRITGRNVGGSTGTNVWSALRLAAEMRASGEEGSVVTLICDSGERYTGTYGSDSWLARQGLDIEPYDQALDAFSLTGDWREPP